MNWLTETPEWLILSGMLLAAMFYLLARLGSRKILFKKITTAILSLTLVVFLFELAYVTDREKLTHAVYEMAHGARWNQPQKVIRHISPTRPEVIEKVSDEMTHLKFDECRVVTIDDITFNRVNQKQATLDFTLFANIDAREKYMCRAKGTRRVRFHFEKEEDQQWRLVNGTNLPLQGISAPVTRFGPVPGKPRGDNLPAGIEFNPPSFDLNIGF
ncbi:MAG: hypothetical protein VYE64_09875 [Planctomycetota bacterium]|nr:hypothetical protein [Planctomycetota bacterium]